MAKRKSPEDFISESAIVHNGKYIYGKTLYKVSARKVTITCPSHGDFEVLAGKHLQGVGCPCCSKETLQHDTKGFISKSEKVHDYFYGYTKTNYVKANEKVVVTCPVHSDFEVTPNNHLKGTGCVRCAHEQKNGTWSYRDWEKAGEISTHFTGYKVYIIECWNDNEQFIKIGKTFVGTSNRFKNSTLMPYSWKLLAEYEGNARYISELESTLHAEYSNYKYSPEIQFGGMYECFQKDSIDLSKLLEYP